jgi:hypothetical protein
LLGGPVGVALGAGAGAAIGGIAAHGDAGFKDERLEKIGEGLEPGTSAIVAVVEHKWVAAVQAQLEEEASDVIAEQLSADIHAQLSEGKEVAYSAIAAEGAASITRTAGNEEEVEQESLVVTDDAVAAQKVVATKEGVATEAVLLTDDAVEVVDAVVTEEGVVVVDTITDGEDTVVAAAVITPEEEEETAADKEESVDAEVVETEEAAPEEKEE